MSKLIGYEKPELKEYSRFGMVAEGASPAGPGEDRTDAKTCNVAGLDEN